MQEAISDVLAQVTALAPQLAAAGVVLLISVGLGRVVANGLTKVIPRERDGSRYPRLLLRGIRVGFAALGVVLGLQILGLTAVATSLLATGGFMAVVLGFAFREIGENLLAGVFLSVSRSFEVGDLIESSGHLGVVRDIDLRQVWIRSGDGRDIFVPSAQIFRNVLINYTRDGLRRADFTVGLDYGDNIAAARDLLLATVSQVEGVLAEPPPSVHVSELSAAYCDIRVNLWVNTDDGPGLAPVRSRVMEVSVAALRDAGFTLSSDVVTALKLDPGSGQSPPLG